MDEEQVWKDFWSRLEAPLARRWVHLAELPDDNDAERGCSRYDYELEAALGSYNHAIESAQDDEARQEALRQLCEMMFQSGAEFTEELVRSGGTSKGRQANVAKGNRNKQLAYEIFDSGITNSDDIAAELLDQHGVKISGRQVRKYLKVR